MSKRAKLKEDPASPFYEGAVTFGQWTDHESLIRAINTAITRIMDRHSLRAVKVGDREDEYREHGALYLSPKAAEFIRKWSTDWADGEEVPSPDQMGLFQFIAIDGDGDPTGEGVLSMLAYESEHGDLILMKSPKMPDALVGYSFSKETYVRA